MKYLTRFEILKIHENAQRFGGSFVKSLTDSLVKADQQNSIKLQDAFSDLFEKYLNIIS